ncbi:hypothetical protein C0J52_16941 [Blattella germanica]|nr:hypothetical protein C0J52_16941 [Blattella germanica]
MTRPFYEPYKTSIVGLEDPFPPPASLPIQHPASSHTHIHRATNAATDMGAEEKGVRCRNQRKWEHPDPPGERQVVAKTSSMCEQWQVVTNASSVDPRGLRPGSNGLKS